jgi:hypothetical protein
MLVGVAPLLARVSPQANPWYTFRLDGMPPFATFATSLPTEIVLPDFFGKQGQATKFYGGFHLYRLNQSMFFYRKTWTDSAYTLFSPVFVS